jgi:hypothetical protein
MKTIEEPVCLPNKTTSGCESGSKTHPLLKRTDLFYFVPFYSAMAKLSNHLGYSASPDFSQISL